MDRVVYSLILNEPHGDGWRGRGGRSESEGNPVFSYIDLVLFLFITQNVIYNFAMNTLYLSFCVDSLPKTTGV